MGSARREDTAAGRKRGYDRDLRAWGPARTGKTGTTLDQESARSEERRTLVGTTLRSVAEPGQPVLRVALGNGGGATRKLQLWSPSRVPPGFFPPT